jgi:pyruvate dehydrogenase E2 component (dihydrolipoamide acetyltransferase)
MPQSGLQAARIDPMITEIRAPKTGLTAETLRIVKWQKAEGEFVEKEEILLTVETEKTTLDIVSPRSGFLKKINFQAEQEVAVSEVIGFLADSMGESPGKAESGKILVSPIARKIAAEHRVQLAKIKGSGPNGRIQKSDVESYLEQQARRRASGDAQDHGDSGAADLSDTIRRATAEATTRSKATIPHYYLFSSFDVTELQARRRTQGDEPKPSILTILIRACSALLEEHPQLNRVWAGDTIVDRPDISVGFVVKTGGGIVIPHVCNAHRMSMIELERTVRALIEQARQMRAPVQALKAGTMSVSNLGMYPVDCFVPIIYPSETAMMGIGRIKKEPIWNGENFVPRDIMSVALALDHRVIDGAEAAEFVRGLKELLEEDGGSDSF